MATKFEIECKAIEKRILRAEIDLLKSEYGRIQKQIDDLKVVQEDILAQSHKKQGEAQEIAEWLDNEQYEYLKANNL